MRVGRSITSTGIPQHRFSECIFNPLRKTGVLLSLSPLSLCATSSGMQTLCVEGCGSYGGGLKSPFLHPKHNFPRRHAIPASSFSFLAGRKQLLVSCRSGGGGKGRSRGKSDGNLHRPKGKENVWSIDNDLALQASHAEKRPNRSLKRPRRKGSARVLVSAAMLMEVEEVLQMQEPVIIPAWNTFASSSSGIWKGVGAVFSPITAEMEPIGINKKGENLYDCYTQSRIEEISSAIKRTTNWVALNPLGERENLSSRRRENSGERNEIPQVLPSFESFDLENSEIMEEDQLSQDLGLVFFEDGSYSRGPVEIPVGDFDQSKYFLSPTFKFEQCLVKGCHKRLRIVHTIEFSQGGAGIEIIRVAVFEEQWVNAVNLDDDESAPALDIKPFSQRQRTRPSDLAGAWKVFEVNCTPVFDDKNDGPVNVFFCMEALKKRILPQSPSNFGEEEMFDQHDVSILWLPGGVTGYVDVLPDGVLCIGVGWYSHEGINLVMERDYGIDGKLKEVRCKTEVKRRWPVDP